MKSGIESEEWWNESVKREMKSEMKSEEWWSESVNSEEWWSESVKSGIESEEWWNESVKREMKSEEWWSESLKSGIESEEWWSESVKSEERNEERVWIVSVKRVKRESVCKESEERESEEWRESVKEWGYIEKGVKSDGFTRSMWGLGLLFHHAVVVWTGCRFYFFNPKERNNRSQ